MGQINSGHAGEGEESEAWGGKVWEATEHVSALIGWLNVIESGWEVYYVYLLKILKVSLSAKFQLLADMKKCPDPLRPFLLFAPWWALFI